MMDCIKEGFLLTNRNLPLVFIKIIASIINTGGVFLFIAIPIMVAVTYLGFDIERLRDIIPALINNPFEFISNYMILLALIILSILFYIVLSSLFLLYVFGGVLGTLRLSIVEPDFRFSLRTFFTEAGMSFGRLIRLLSLLSLIALPFGFFLIVSNGISIFFYRSITPDLGFTDTFLRTFMAVLIFIFSLIIGFTGLTVGVYSFIISVAEKKGAFSSISGAFQFVRERPGAVLFYLLLIVMILTLSMILYVFQMPLHLNPTGGILTGISIYILNLLFQSYISVVIWSSLLAFYLKYRRTSSFFTVSSPEIPITQ